MKYICVRRILSGTLLGANHAPQVNRLTTSNASNASHRDGLCLFPPDFDNELTIRHVHNVYPAFPEI